MDQTLNLLREVNAGCKSATNAIEQLRAYSRDPGLSALMDKYDARHARLGERCHATLVAAGHREKDPAPVAAAMAKMGISMKMALDDGTAHIADMLEDGCTMGIKSLAKYRNQYPDASAESRALAGEVISTEMQMAEELLPYL